MSTEEIKALFEELKVALNGLDVPAYRKTSIHWLSRNLAVRNSNHANYPKAAEIVEKLRAAGVSTEPP